MRQGLSGWICEGDGEICARRQNARAERPAVDPRVKPEDDDRSSGDLVGMKPAAPPLEQGREIARLNQAAFCAAPYGSNRV